MAVSHSGISARQCIRNPLLQHLVGYDATVSPTKPAPPDIFATLSSTPKARVQQPCFLADTVRYAHYTAGSAVNAGNSSWAAALVIQG